MIPEPAIAAFPPPLYSSPQRLIDGHLPPTMGPRIGAWMERYLVHGEGDSQGQPVRHSPHQQYVLNKIYEYDPATGKLLYDRVVIGIGKGNSKTEDAAFIGLAELAGPCRPLLSPRVVSSAATYDQADNVFAAAKAGIEGGPLAAHFDCFDTEILPRNGRGVFERIAARGGTADGKLLTCHVGDELHEWKTGPQKRVYIVQGKGLRKRQIPRQGGISGGLQISISTSGDDPDSLLGVLYQHGIRVATSEVDDPTFLILWWEAPQAEDEDLSDPIQLRSAVLAANPAAGAGGWLTPEQIEANFHDPTIPRYESERYNLNRWVVRERAWIAPQTWQDRASADGWPADGEEVYIGFKGSYNRAATALVGWTRDDYGFVIEAWERENQDPSWTVPREEVAVALEQAMERWRVVELACDPVGWLTEVESWELRYGERSVRVNPLDDSEALLLDGVVLTFDTNSKRMQQAVDRFKSAVVDENSVLRHDGDARLARHVNNCNARRGRWGTVLEPEVAETPRHIDVALAAVIARQRALQTPGAPRRPVILGSL